MEYDLGVFCTTGAKAMLFTLILQAVTSNYD